MATISPGAPAPASVSPQAYGVQGTLDELGTPLRQVTFVVVDLETTGASPGDCAITEIGAVKVRGGEVLGEFQTLVNPAAPIPAFIAVLTGITDAMVAGAPTISPVLAAFLDFSAGAVLVAHNAPFDIGFLKAACAATGRPWPGNEVLDTVRLARRVLPRGEVPDVKLATLARHFGTETSPTHRALDDARATVEVLHALMSRVGNLGVHSLEELRTYSSRVPSAIRRKRHLAEGLPHAPGVYLFKDDRGKVLYVGVSVDIRTRVRSYFTASEQRARMAQMVTLATQVTPIVCATPLEARVRELRLIAEHKPRYNRRSVNPERSPWLKLTAEVYPRLSVVREVRDDGATYIGPFTSALGAQEAMIALYEAFPIRQCTRKLAAKPSRAATACLLAEMGRCPAPCIGSVDVDGYAPVAEAVRAAMQSDARSVVEAGLARAGALAAQERFEEAAVHRDRLVAFLRGAARAQRLGPLAAASELLAARRTPAGGWEIVLIRHGRLAGTTVSPPGADPTPYLEAVQATGEHAQARPAPMPAAHPEEAEQLLGWLEQPGVRLVQLDGEWAHPIHGAAGAQSRLGRSLEPGPDLGPQSTTGTGPESGPQARRPPAPSTSWSPPWGDVDDWGRRHAQAGFRLSSARP